MTKTEVVIKWSAEDIQQLRPDWALDYCEEVLEKFGRALTDRSIEVGWEIMEVLLSMEEDEQKVAVGAYVTVRYVDAVATTRAYVSFGTYDEEKDTDSFGKQDTDVFYYFEEGLGEMLEYINENHPSADFTIIDYDVVFATKTKGDN